MCTQINTSDYIKLRELYNDFTDNEINQVLSYVETLKSERIQEPFQSQ